MENKAFDHSKYRDWIDPNAVKPYERNAKIHDEKQIKNIVNSIKRFGWQQDTVITTDNVLVIGHGRRLAALQIGCEMPYHRIDKEANAETGFDFDIMCMETLDLNFDGFDFDFNAPDGGGLDEIDIVEDDPPAPPEEPTAKRGDIWMLGEHRLMCGDSTNLAEVEKLMNGKLAELFLTDPPYNVNYKGGTKEKMTILNDNQEDESFRAFLIDAFKNANTVMKDGAAFYIWHADGNTSGFNFRYAVRYAGWSIRQCLIWVKNNLVLGRQDYQWRHEPCLYGWKDGTHYFINDRTQTTVIDDKIDLKKLKKEELLAILEQIYSDKVPTTVIYEDKPLTNDIHPTMKPLRFDGHTDQEQHKKGPGRAGPIWGKWVYDDGV